VSKTAFGLANEKKLLCVEPLLLFFGKLTDGPGYLAYQAQPLLTVVLQHLW